MIQFLEFIVLLSGVGNLTISWTLFKEIHWQDVVIIIISVIYSISPNQQVNYFFFIFIRSQIFCSLLNQNQKISPIRRLKMNLLQTTI